jgi:hypothetical protein
MIVVQQKFLLEIFAEHPKFCILSRPFVKMRFKFIKKQIFMRLKI